MKLLLLTILSFACWAADPMVLAHRDGDLDARALQCGFSIGAGQQVELKQSLWTAFGSFNLSSLMVQNARQNVCWFAP